MDLKQYEKEIRRTCPELGSTFVNELHMVIGVATEAGELLDVYKKNLAYRKPMDRVNIGEEIGDCLWYLINLCDMLKIDPETVMELNVAKLRERYPEKFTAEKAINRDLDAERKTLEGETNGINQ
jgi:NTP pyrophosphatase (non-canonical NTP hydrolase)